MRFRRRRSYSRRRVPVGRRRGVRRLRRRRSVRPIRIGYRM